MQLIDAMARIGVESAFEVLAKARALEAQGKHIIHLQIGEPDFPTPRHVIEAGQKALAEGYTKYGPTQGDPDLRAAIARYVSRTRGIEVGPQHVCVTPGGKPIMYFAIIALVGPGDEAIFADPGFPIYESMIRFQGATPVSVPLVEERGFTLDLDVLESKLTDRTRLVVLNSPQNPTGGIIPKQDMEAIAAILRSHPQVWVFADEVYSQLCYEGEFVSLAQFPDMLERTIISDGASKTWAMTGWRLGFTANKALAPVFTRWVTNTDSCASQVTQWAAVEAIRGPQDEAKRMRDSFLARRDLIVGLLNKVPGVTCRNPGGAFYVWPNVTAACEMIGAKDSEELRKRLLHEAGVAVVADIHFGSRVPREGQHIRFSYAASNEAIEKGMARMADFIRASTRIKKTA